MAMRDKQLKAFGMTVNEKGQVIASSKHLEEMEKDLAEEPGLKCCICLEGYKNQPKKVQCPLYTEEYSLSAYCRYWGYTLTTEKSLWMSLRTRLGKLKDFVQYLISTSSTLSVMPLL